MSQYKFEHNDHEILVGWDDPLQYYFMNVERLSDGEMLFTNLDLPNPAMSIKDIKKMCMVFGAVLPEDFERRMIADGEGGKKQSDESSNNIGLSVEMAGKTIAFYQQLVGGESPHEAVQDVMTDLYHWCDAHGVDFLEVVDYARRHHAHEAPQ